MKLINKIQNILPQRFKLSHTPRLLFIVPIRLYQLLISPVLPPSCRFYPSCSAYAVEAVTRHGAMRGGWLAICRLARCHPWNPGGIDLVPPHFSPRKSGVQER